MDIHTILLTVDTTLYIIAVLRELICASKMQLAVDQIRWLFFLLLLFSLYYDLVCL